MSGKNILSGRDYDVGLQLPGLGGHGAEPVVEEGHEADLSDAVGVAVGDVAGVGHGEEVVVVGVRGAAVVVADADGPVAAPEVPAHHDGALSLQLLSEEACGLAVVGEGLRGVAHGLYAQEGGVGEQGGGGAGPEAGGHDVEIGAAVEVAVEFLHAGAVVRPQDGGARAGVGGAAVDMGVHLGSERLFALAVGVEVLHHHPGRHAAAGVVGGLLQGGEVVQKQCGACAVAGACRQQQEYEQYVVVFLHYGLFFIF